MSMIQKIEIDGKQVPFKVSAAIPRIYRIKFHRDIYKDLDALGKLSETGMRVLPISICSPLRCLRTSPTSWQSMQIPPSRTAQRNGLMSSAPAPSTRCFRKSSNFGA